MSEHGGWHSSVRRSRKFHLLVVLLLVTIASVLPATAQAAGEVAVPGGRAYDQAAGPTGGAYSVVDQDGIAFWTTLQQLGGVHEFGYPVSRRHFWKGNVGQFFQKGLLVGDPATGVVSVANLFDDLHQAGLDDAILERYGIPPHEWLPDEQSLSWPEVVAGRLAWLDADPRLRQFYDAHPDALARFGLPTSQIHDAGAFFSIRLQRAAFQLWKVDGPGIPAGSVTVVNGGDIARELGAISAEALQPESTALALRTDAPCPTPALNSIPSQRPLVVLDPGHGGGDTGAVARFADGSSLAERVLNLQIAERAAAHLREAGYGVILTRTNSAGANTTNCDANGDGRVSLADDLQVRIDIANASGADLFVSIHNNGHSNRSLNGTEVYYSGAHPLAARNRQLASVVQRHIVANLHAAGYPTHDRGIRTDQSIGRRFFVLTPGPRVARPLRMPGVLGESLFLSNPSDADALRRPEIVDAIGKGYAEAIREFLGK